MPSRGCMAPVCYSRLATVAAQSWTSACIAQEDNYEPVVACSGYTSTEAGVPVMDVLRVGATDDRASVPFTYTCYGSRSALPFDRMWSYLANVSRAGPPQDGRLYSHQAAWQETDASVAIGIAHGSSLLLDEQQSRLNARLAERVASGAWDVTRANLIEINHVCDSGPRLREALRRAQAGAHMPPEWR